MTRVRTAIIGTGFMGRVHLEAVRRLGFVDVAAVVGSRVEKARALAATFGIERAEGDYRAIVGDRSIDAVHICTPNVRHFPMASAALLAGKHVMCEKPLAVTTREAEELVRLAAVRQLRNCTCHNLRCYPLVQQMRWMRESGELGDILIAQGTYSQDWLLYDTDWNWRVDRAEAGSLRAMGDIGSHWCDMVEHISGQRIASLAADLQTFHKTRKQPADSAATFAARAENAAASLDRPVTTEDFGAVLFHLGDRARGAFTVSQVSAGCKNRLSVEIFGTKGSVAWNQERPNELWIGSRDQSNRTLTKDPALLAAGARPYADLPGGHAEGYHETFKQLFDRFHRSILDQSAPLDYPQFTDGLRQMRLLDAIKSSHERRAWVDVAV